MPAVNAYIVSRSHLMVDDALFILAVMTIAIICVVIVCTACDMYFKMRELEKENRKNSSNTSL